MVERFLTQFLLLVAAFRDRSQPSHMSWDIADNGMPLPATREGGIPQPSLPATQVEFVHLY